MGCDILRLQFFNKMSSTRKITILGLCILGLILFSFLFILISNKVFPRQDVPTINEGSVIAENWIRNYSSSYPIYGKELRLINQKEIERGEYEFIFSFITESLDYGRQENKIAVRTKNTEIVKAITNNIFDEISGKFVERTETVKLFFILEEENIVQSVERTISTSVLDDMSKVLIEKLLEGPSEEERENGYTTHIENETRLFSYRIEEGIAYLELSIAYNIQTDMAKEQISKTLAQLDDIREVRAPERKQVITVNVEGIPEEFSFNRELQEGSQGVDVKYLQIILNADPDTMVAQQGPGSPGEEGESFGESTARAVKAFQRKYTDEVLRPAGLILSSGIVDEYTRDKLNAILEENRW
jgi:hypothetical protein